jgi:hypothetical protein
LARGVAAGNEGSLAVVTGIEHVVGEARFIWASRDMTVAVGRQGWHSFL